MATSTLERVSLDEYERYLTERTRANTVIAYMAAMREFTDWLGDEPPTREATQEFIDSLQRQGKAANTVAIKANAIRRWFKWQGNPVFLDTPSARMHEPEYLTREQLDKLLLACVTPLERVLLIGLFDTACRISEFLNISLSDIDWDNGLITVTRKGGRVAQVNVSDKALEALKDWLDCRKSRSSSVFMGMVYHDAWLTVKGIGERAGIPLHPHLLRHSRAIQLLAGGAEIWVVQQVLGHVNIGTTMNIYGRYMPIHLKEKIVPW